MIAPSGIVVVVDCGCVVVDIVVVTVDVVLCRDGSGIVLVLVVDVVLVTLLAMIRRRMP